ncbi:MAG: RNA-binding S4 domain-containing protein [Hyphomicrobiaceae bacterium]
MTPKAVSADEDGGASAGQRLDKWLWFARLVKSRTSAAALVTSGKVRVNRDRIDKPSHWLKPGDVVTVTVSRRVRVLKVLLPGTRRGPAPEARLLFEDLSPQVAASPQADASPVVTSAQRSLGTGRPTKKERRKIDQLRGRE